MTAKEARDRVTNKEGLNREDAKTLLKLIYAQVADESELGRTSLDLTYFFNNPETQNIKNLVVKELEDKGYKINYGHQLDNCFNLEW